MHHLNLNKQYDRYENRSYEMMQHKNKAEMLRSQIDSYLHFHLILYYLFNYLFNLIIILHIYEQL